MIGCVAMNELARVLLRRGVQLNNTERLLIIRQQAIIRQRMVRSGGELVLVGELIRPDSERRISTL